MPVIHVEMFPGRDIETRRRLVRELTDAYVNVCGGRPQAIHILLKEIDQDRWANGGELYSDLLAD